MLASHHHRAQFNAPIEEETKWNTSIDALLEGWNSACVDWKKVREDVLEVNTTKYLHTGYVETEFDDVYKQVLDQLSSLLSPIVWAGLPGEIVDYVVDTVLPSISKQPERKIKRILSTFSLVCKRWSYHCRPFLFHRLILFRPSDPYFLSTILTSPISGWLCDHVQKITFKQIGSISNPESSQSLCVANLPGLRRISYAYQNRTGGNGPIVPIALRTVWANNTLPLSHIQLETYRFHSVSTLLRMLGALPHLEDVQLYRVSWNVETTDAVLHCKAGFASLRRVRVTECQDRWPFAWMFAAASMGHTFKFLRRGEEASVPRDVLAVARVCKMFGDAKKYRTAILQKQEAAGKDEYAFTYRLTHSDGNMPTHHSYELAFISSPAPIHERSTSPTRTLNRLLISVSPDVPFASLTAVPWQNLDAFLNPTNASLTVLLGSSITSNEAKFLDVELPRWMPRTIMRVKHWLNENGDDVGDVETGLFRWEVWTSDVSEVFAIDPVKREFEAAKYVRL